MQRLLRSNAYIVSTVLVLGAACFASTPDWLRDASRRPVPTVGAKVKAICLLDEEKIAVSENGEERRFVRRAYRILRHDADEYGIATVDYRNGDKLYDIRGWTIAANHVEYELKSKDSVESNHYDGELYDDLRQRRLILPALEPGSVIGYEYDVSEHPLVRYETWAFQTDVPHLQSSFDIELPAGWTLQSRTVNHADIGAIRNGQGWSWSISNVPEIQIEPQMPDWGTLSARMLIRYGSQTTIGTDPVVGWKSFADWYRGISKDRSAGTPAIHAKVQELVGSSTSQWEKMLALTRFAQRNIRYVAIEIGIGGWQPHPAADIFQNSYGDCKDKATLLKAMLWDIGVDSSLVLISTEHDEVVPDFPGGFGFNHAILAVRIPPELVAKHFPASASDPVLGDILFFDPTSRDVPLGHLPAYLQSNYGLIVGTSSSALVKLPTASADDNRMERKGRFRINEDGALVGEIEEHYSGNAAANLRSGLSPLNKEDRRRAYETFLARFVNSGLKLNDLDFDDLDTARETLTVRYTFAGTDYMKRAGNMLLVRARVLGDKSEEALEDKERMNPVAFDYFNIETDDFEIQLPTGLQIEELPEGLKLDAGSIRYDSSTTFKDGVLHYQRKKETQTLQIPKEQFPAYKTFYRRIMADQRASVVLRKTQ